MDYTRFKKLKIKHDKSNLIIEKGFIIDIRSKKINDRNYVVYPIAETQVHYYIVCPYCGEIHLHGVQGGKGARQPHCNIENNGIYTIK